MNHRFRRSSTVVEAVRAPVVTASPTELVVTGTPLGVLQTHCDQLARASFHDQRASSSWHPHQDVTLAALGSAVLVMMVKDESDIIRQNLQHHYKLGFRYFFVLDNRSNDATSAVIAEFRAGHPDAQVACLYDFVVGYYQAAKMAAVVAFLSIYLEHENNPGRWLFFVDADEFITFCAGDVVEGPKRISAALDDPAHKMLVMHWAQCASMEVVEHDTPDRSLLETHTRIWTTMEPAVTKVAIRMDAGMTTRQGNHMVESFPYQTDAAVVLAEFGLYMLHFPQRSVDQMRRKVVNGAAAYAATKGQENHGGHWRQYYEWYSQNGDVVLRQLIQQHIDSCS